MRWYAVNKNKKYYKLTKYFSSQAKDQDVFFIHNNVGYNYGMTNISAALGIGQINIINKILKKKEKIKNLYKKYFKEKKKEYVSSMGLNIQKITIG